MNPHVFVYGISIKLINIGIKEWSFNLNINNKIVSLKIDIGAMVDVMPMKEIEEIRI